MKIKVMAKARTAEQMPQFKSFGRSGIRFPSLEHGHPHGGPIEVTLVKGSPYPDAYEVDEDGMKAILSESMLLVEDSPEVREMLKPLVAEAEKAHEKWTGAGIVAAGAFDSMAADVEVPGVEMVHMDGYETMSKAELADAAENRSIDTKGMSKDDLVKALRGAG